MIKMIIMIMKIMMIIISYNKLVLNTLSTKLTGSANIAEWLIPFLSLLALTLSPFKCPSLKQGPISSYIVSWPHAWSIIHNIYPLF